MTYPSLNVYLDRVGKPTYLNWLWTHGMKEKALKLWIVGRMS